MYKHKVIFIGLIAMLLTPLFLPASEPTPRLINYQGRLTNAAGAPLDGVTVDLGFSFYATPTGGAPLLTVIEEDVLVTAGIYQVLIGSGQVMYTGSATTLSEVFHQASEVWMGVKVNADDEMTPRSQISSSPYAFRADRVDGAWLDEFITAHDYDGDGDPKRLYGGFDCNDEDFMISSLAMDIWCDGIDQDCDGIDDGEWEAGYESRVTYTPDSSSLGAIVANSIDFGISWQEYFPDGNSEIYFARVSGDSIIGSMLRVTDAPQMSYMPALAWTGSEYGLSWVDNRDDVHRIYFTRISAAAAKIGGDILLTDTDGGSYPSLAWTGSEFGVAWTHYNQDIYFLRLSPQGAKIGAEVRVSNAPGVSPAPDLVWATSFFGVLWTDARDGNLELYFNRISSQGAVLGPESRVTQNSGDSQRGDLVWTGSLFAIAWSDASPGNQEIFFNRISDQGVKLDQDRRVTYAIQASELPDLIKNGSNFGLTWSDMRHDRDNVCDATECNWEIYFARLSATGAPIGDEIRVTNTSWREALPLFGDFGSYYEIYFQDWRDNNDEVYYSWTAGDCPLP